MFKRLKAAWKVLNGELSTVPSKFMRDDAIVGHFSISSSKEYTRINIQGREFFFTTEGTFDGTGMSSSHCCSPLTLVK